MIGVLPVEMIVHHNIVTCIFLLPSTSHIPRVAMAEHLQTQYKLGSNTKYVNSMDDKNFNYNSP